MRRAVADSGNILFEHEHAVDGIVFQKGYHFCVVPVLIRHCGHILSCRKNRLQSNKKENRQKQYIHQQKGAQYCALPFFTKPNYFFASPHRFHPGKNGRLRTRLQISNRFYSTVCLPFWIENDNAPIWASFLGVPGIFFGTSFHTALAYYRFHPNNQAE